MSSVLFWVYLVNAILLILHEMDSAYWKEWDLFGLPGSIGTFLTIHVPLYAALFLGLVFLALGAAAGPWISLVAALGGGCAFGIHTMFLRRGRPEFSTRPSRVILYALLVGSALQAVLTLERLLG
jgi:hypothetical protein